MKRRLWIAAGIALAATLVIGIGFWKEAQTISRETEHILGLQYILTLAENRGAEWATDELMINEIERYSKKSLYKKWGDPTESMEAEKKDVWILSDQFQLIADYDDNGRVESVKVISNT